ncbi:MAG TPA: glycoside hydrolase family 11 protein [Bacillota bacterium]|nr:glycoside hydrolase family 11 protein [Bacillota bacterium]
MRKNLFKILALLMCFTVMAVVNIQAETTEQTGSHDGYFYYFRNDDRQGSVNLTLGPGGNYSVDWSDCYEFICGKGWNPGSDRTITYSGSFSPGINSWLGVYGNARMSIDAPYFVEYYVVENYGAWTPPGGTSSGTVNSDGGTYNLYRHQRSSGITGSFQYWSVRTSKRSSGTITLRNHFNAWAQLGWNLGVHTFQVMAVEGYQSTGNANITVSEGPINPTPTSQPTPSAPTKPTPTPPNPTATPTPTRPVGPTATPTRVIGNYVVSYAVQSNWGTGGTVGVTIKNNTAVAVNGWTLVFNLPSGTTISNLWNGTYTQNGTTVTVKNAGWNGTIGQSGGSANFGFNYNGSKGAGSGFTLNGTACSLQ